MKWEITWYILIIIDPLLLRTIQSNVDQFALNIRIVSSCSMFPQHCLSHSQVTRMGGIQHMHHWPYKLAIIRWNIFRQAHDVIIKEIGIKTTLCIRRIYMFRFWKTKVIEHFTPISKDYFQSHGQQMKILTNARLWYVFGIVIGVPSVRWRIGAVWSPSVQQHLADTNEEFFSYGPCIGFDIDGEIGIWPAYIFWQFPFIKVIYRYKCITFRRISCLNLFLMPHSGHGATTTTAELSWYEGIMISLTRATLF